MIDQERDVKIRTAILFECYKRAYGQSENAEKFFYVIPELRDYENIPLKQDITKYFQKEVEPFVNHPWIDESTRDKVGYEIPFTRRFYTFKPLRTVEEIDKDIHQLQKEISKDLEELM